MKIDDDLYNEFPNSGKTYLNNASVSLMPSVSIDAMKDFLVSYNSLGPDSLASEPFVEECLQKVRRKVSELINCQPDEIVLTQSTTDGINIVANGFSFKERSNIILRGGPHEHHSNYFAWLNLQDKVVLKILGIDKDGFFDFEELEKFIDGDTSLVSLSHGLYNTGSILPVEEIGKILEKYTVPYFLDTAQTIGCIGEFDVQRTKCNFMSFNGSKWLCGPMGTGLFYCSRSSSNLLTPTDIGGESVIHYEESKLAYKGMPDKFQTGFRNYVGMVGLESSLDFMKKLGFENIRKKNIRLATLLRDELAKIPEVEIYGPDDPEKRTSIVSFNISKREPSYVVEKLERSNFVLAEREIVDKKIVRASPHFFNTESEMMDLVEEIKKL